MKLAKIRGGVFVRGYARFVRLARASDRSSRASDTRVIWCGFRIAAEEKQNESEKTNPDHLRGTQA